MVPRALPANEELRGRLSRIAANHLALIRSILIEFRGSVTLASGHLCKKIRYVDVHASSIVRAKRNDQYAQILF